jgi:hypothetical protein
MNRIWRERLALWAAASALLTAPGSARADWLFYDGANRWSTAEFIDFYSHPNDPTHDDYPIGTFDDAHPRVRYHTYTFTNSSSDGVCFEVETMGSTEAVMVGPTDTRLWVYDPGTGGYHGLNDDITAGNLFSKARIYRRGAASGDAGGIRLIVTVYSESSNISNFDLRITRLDLGQTSCTSGSGQLTLPWVANVNGTLTFSANAR